MRIIVDENIPYADKFLSGIGEVKTLPGRQIDAKQVQKANALLVRSVTRVNRSLIEGSKVTFVASATAGVDHVDQTYLNKKSITFSWALGCNAVAVVEYVISAIVEASLYKKEDWLNKKVGIIGRGEVGSRLHARLKRLGVNCLIYDPFNPAEDGSDVAFNDLLCSADIITLHVPLTKAGNYPTWRMINKKTLTSMKADAMLINTARGGVIDEKALSQHLMKHRSFLVVLDVWDNEPTINLHLLRQVFIATGHIAGYTLEGKLRGTEMACQSLCNYLQKKMTVSMAAYVPSVSLEAPLKADLSSLFSSVIHSVYSIREDADRFKQSLLKANKISQCFDVYRKHYRVRREFGSYQLSPQFSEVLRKNPQLSHCLSNLGFCVV